MTTATQPAKKTLAEKWMEYKANIEKGLPTIVIQFAGPGNVLFESQMFNSPQEAQCDIAGSELVTLARLLRDMRIMAQVVPPDMRPITQAQLREAVEKVKGKP